MSAATLRDTPCASNSLLRSKNTWLATCASGARIPAVVANWATNTVVCWMSMSMSNLTFIGDLYGELQI